MLDSKKFSYKNTLIYTIITAIVSVGLLVLLAFKGFFDYIYLIAIVELGIFCIIGYCIFRIINYEKGLDRMKLNSNNFIAFNECPDYFVKKFDTSGTPYCSNEYQVKDKVNNSYIMKIYPPGIPLPSQHDPSLTPDNANKYEKFWLNEITNAKELKTMKDKCVVLSTEPTDPRLSKYRGYTNVPWTYVRGRCEGFF